MGRGGRGRNAHTKGDTSQQTGARLKDPFLCPVRADLLCCRMMQTATNDIDATVAAGSGSTSAYTQGEMKRTSMDVETVLLHGGFTLPEVAIAARLPAAVKAAFSASALALQQALRNYMLARIPATVMTAAVCAHSSSSSSSAYTVPRLLLAACRYDNISALEQLSLLYRTPIHTHTPSSSSSTSTFYSAPAISAASALFSAGEVEALRLYHSGGAGEAAEAAAEEEGAEGGARASEDDEEEDLPVKSCSAGGDSTHVVPDLSWRSFLEIPIDPACGGGVTDVVDGEYDGEGRRQCMVPQASLLELAIACGSPSCVQYLTQVAGVTVRWEVFLWALHSRRLPEYALVGLFKAAIVHINSTQDYPGDAFNMDSLLHAQQHVYEASAFATAVAFASVQPSSSSSRSPLVPVSRTSSSLSSSPSSHRGNNGVGDADDWITVVEDETLLHPGRAARAGAAGCLSAGSGRRGVVSGCLCLLCVRLQRRRGAWSGLAGAIPQLP